MTPAEYRKQVERELEMAAAQESVTGGDVLSDPADDLAILGDTGAPEETRMAALTRLSGASFDIVRFAPHRVEYLEALRDLVRETLDSALGKEALATLAPMGDAVAQQVLKDALDKPDAAKIGLADALRLLAADDHANVAAIARRLFAETEDADIREEALRALAADPASQDLMREIFVDGSRPLSLRIIAATALRQMDPAAFSDLATPVISDTNEDAALRAAVMSTLATIGGALDSGRRNGIDIAISALPDDGAEGIAESAARLKSRVRNDEPEEMMEESIGGAGPAILVTRSF